MKRHLAIVAAVLIAFSAPAVAHGPTGAKVSGANGGDIVDVEGGHIELVLKPAELVLYVTDLNDAPLATAGLAGRVVIQDGEQQATVPLAPRAPNLLVAPLAKPVSKDAKIAVSAALAKDGKPVQARFVAK